MNQYWEQLRITYLKNVNEGISTRICYLTDHHGWQSGKYWLLSSQVCFRIILNFDILDLKNVKRRTTSCYYLYIWLDLLPVVSVLTK